MGVESGRAGAIKGDPDSAASRGLACAKGYYSVQAAYGADRLTRALVRRGSTQQAVPLGEAVDLVARRIREASDQHGKASVAVYGSAQWTLSDAHIASSLFQSGLDTPNVWSEQTVLGAAGTAGLRTTFGSAGSLGSYADIDRADVFVLWDANLAETHPVLFSRMLERRRRDRAVRIVDLATRTTRTAYGADEALLHRPLTLLAVANAVSAELIARRRANREFIGRHVTFLRDDAASAGFDDFAAFISEYSAARAQQISGIPADRIRWLASLYGDPSRKVMSVWGANVNGQTHGTATNNAIYNLHLLTGKVGTPGNSALSLDASAGGMAEGADTSAALSMARALDGRNVRVLWIQGSNPAVDLPALDRLLRTAAEDRFVVASDSYPTATTRIADVVLPSALWFEREGIHVNAERRLQHNAELVSPPGDSTAFGWQMIEVARRLGLARLFPWERSNYEERAWEEFRAAAANQMPALPEMSALRSDRASQLPGAWKGRGSVWLRPYQEPVESPDREYPFWLNVGAVLEHSGTGTLTSRIPTLHRGAPHAYVEMNREDAQRLGIRSGETVRLVSRRGALQLQARVDYRSQPQPGLVFVPSFDEALPVAKLMPNAFDLLSGQPHTTTCAVRIERTTAGRGG